MARYSLFVLKVPLNPDQPAISSVQLKMKKKRSEAMQTLRAGCSKAEPKISPRRRPPSRRRRMAKI